MSQVYSLDENCVSTTFCQTASEHLSNINIPPVSFVLGHFQRMCEECVTSCQVTLGDFTAMLEYGVLGQVCEYHGV